MKKTITLKKIIFSILIALAPACYNTIIAQAFSENFDDITTLSGSGWVITNASVAVGSSNWFQNRVPGPFDAYNGAANASISADYNSTGSVGTISTWLMTPNRTFKNGDVITFYTRKSAPDTYGDRLEVRLSTNGASTSVGNGNGVGDYNTLLLSVNPSLILGVYPTTWTMYTVTISGLPAPTSGRIAFRYFVTSAGLNGTNSDYISIDQVDYTPYVCPAFTISPTTLTGGSAGTAYSASLSQTGALGTPTYAITAGALPPGLALSASGTISGTPTATGTFNFTVTVSDASGCSGALPSSITAVCPPSPLTLSFSDICSNDPLLTLTQGSPAGGIYFGTGVSSGQFDPAAGTQTIYYDHTDPYGCAHMAYSTITVNAAPIVSIPPLDDLCIDVGTVSLSGGSPEGGTYTGTDVTLNEFTPSSTGTTTITYTFTDANNCTNNASTGITVNDLPVITSTSTVDPVCLNSDPIPLELYDPAGGTYSGDDLTSGIFTPATSGESEITYSYTDANGCTSTENTSITVNALPAVTLDAFDPVCQSATAFNLEGGAPSGGTYSGADVTGGVVFTPSTNGPSQVTYSYTDANGCESSADASITVQVCTDIVSGSPFLGVNCFPNPSTGMVTI